MPQAVRAALARVGGNRWLKRPALALAAESALLVGHGSPDICSPSGTRTQLCDSVTALIYLC